MDDYDYVEQPESAIMIEIWHDFTPEERSIISTYTEIPIAVLALTKISTVCKQLCPSMSVPGTQSGGLHTHISPTQGLQFTTQPVRWNWDILGNKMLIIDSPNGVSWYRRLVTHILFGSKWTMHMDEETRYTLKESKYAGCVLPGIILAIILIIPIWSIWLHWDGKKIDSQYEGQP